MTKKQLQNIKDKLEKEKSRIEAELLSMAHRNPSTSETDFEADYKDVGDDDEDNASEVAQYTSDLSVSSELEKTLRDI